MAEARNDAYSMAFIWKRHSYSKGKVAVLRWAMSKTSRSET